MSVNDNVTNFPFTPLPADDDGDSTPDVLLVAADLEDRAVLLSLGREELMALSSHYANKADWLAEPLRVGAAPARLAEVIFYSRESGRYRGMAQGIRDIESA